MKSFIDVSVVEDGGKQFLFGITANQKTGQPEVVGHTDPDYFREGVGRVFEQLIREEQRKEADIKLQLAFIKAVKEHPGKQLQLTLCYSANGPSAGEFYWVEDRCYTADGVSFLSNAPVCIYHKNCLDGTAAAWAVRSALPLVELVAMSYHDDPYELFGSGLEYLQGKTIYCVDFSFKKAVVEAIANLPDTVLIILDHHESAQRELGELVVGYSGKSTLGDRVEIIIDMTRSGAKLTYDYFNPQQPTPPGILAVQDRDLWKWEYEGSKEWTAAAFGYPLTVESFDKLIHRDYQDVVEEGRTVLRKQELDVEKLLPSARPYTLEGYNCLIVNASYFHASDVGDKLKGRDGIDFVVTYMDGKDSRIFSLRGKDKVNLAEVAERFGGGGHPNAAGFSLSYDDPRFSQSHLSLYSGT